MTSKLNLNGPPNCDCFHCCTKPSSEKGEHPCEYYNHHCESCHDEDKCSYEKCIEDRKLMKSVLDSATSSLHAPVPLKENLVDYARASSDSNGKFTSLEFSEEERQVILMALGHLGAARPGLDGLLDGIAKRMDLIENDSSRLYVIFKKMKSV